MIISNGLQDCINKINGNKSVPIILYALFETIKESMIDGNNIYIRGFGSFVNKKRAGRIARDINKGTDIIVSEYYEPIFKPSPNFKRIIKEANTPTKRVNAKKKRNYRKENEMTKLREFKKRVR